MYTGFILRANETSGIEKVNKARVTFDYENEDVVVILNNGKPVQMETLSGAEVALQRQFESMEDALQALLDHLTNPPVVEA